MPVISSATQSGKKAACRAEIQQLQAALKVYEQEYSDFPPSRLKPIGIEKHNEINEGIESLVACLSSMTRMQAPFFEFKEDKLENKDQDTSPISLARLTGSCFKGNELWEMVDPWDNPYVYFHYKELQSETRQWYSAKDGKKEIAPNMKANKMGIIQGSSSYQIFSVGPDELPHTEDDLKPE